MTLLDLLAIGFFLSGIYLVARWIQSVVHIRVTSPAPAHSFTLGAMRDRRFRRRSGLYLGAGLLCAGMGLVLSGLALQA